MNKFTVFYVWYEKDDGLWLDGVRVRGKRKMYAKTIIDAVLTKESGFTWPVNGYLNTNTDTFSFTDKEV